MAKFLVPEYNSNTHKYVVNLPNVWWGVDKDWNPYIREPFREWLDTNLVDGWSMDQFKVVAFVFLNSFEDAMMFELSWS